jgi:hypothetical protein
MRKLVLVSSGMTWSFLAENCQGDRYTLRMWQEFTVSGSCPVVGFGITAIICLLPDAFTSKQVNYMLWVGKTHTYSQEQKDPNDIYQELSYLEDGEEQQAYMKADFACSQICTSWICIKANVFMEIITAYPEDYTTPTNTLCGKSI